MSSHLIFRKPRAERDPLDLRLRFGDADAAESAAIDLNIRAMLQSPQLRVRAVYDHRVTRKVVGCGAMCWRRGKRNCQITRDGWEDTERSRGVASLPWKRGKNHAGTVRSDYGGNTQHRAAMRVPWGGAAQTKCTVSLPHGILVQTRNTSSLPWKDGLPLPASVTDRFVFLLPIRSGAIVPWTESDSASKSWQQDFGRGVPLVKDWRIPWEEGRRPSRGLTPFEPPKPPDPFAPNYNADLVFKCPTIFDGLRWLPSLPLRFGGECWSDDYGIPVLEVYFVSNDISVVRLPGREPIGVIDVRLSIDDASWAWGMSARIAARDLELVEPTADGPVEIEITINGATWIMLVEKYNRSREFNSDSVNIEGRSRAAYLAQPYAPVRSFTPTSPFTARQLAEQELTRAGLITGFDLDWGLPDWLVPAGAWGYQALTPMSVVQRIAEAVGGYVNAHHYSKSLLVKPRYPHLPWEWNSAAPDLELPNEAILSHAMNWNEMPDYNAVFVSGERSGVTGRVVRAGTAGDLQAQMVADALITHADAARERGRSILGNAGKQASVTITLPMFRNIGLLTPGMLLETGKVSDRWRGLVRSTSVSASFGSALTIRQSIGVERHYG